MSSGEPLLLGVGAPGAETIYAVITPGGNGYIDLELIPTGSRLSVKAVNAVTVSEGSLITNLMG